VTSQEIVNTEWALQLWEGTTPEYFYEIVDRMVAKKPVFVAWMGDSAEISLGSYTIHSTPTMVEALEWCQQFELPVRVQASSDTVPKLLKWLDAECNDKAASWTVKNIMSVVREKVYELMKEQK
jgi:hypothetical protein